MSFADLDTGHGAVRSSINQPTRSERRVTDALRKFQDQCKMLNLSIQHESNNQIKIRELADSATESATEAKKSLEEFWTETQTKSGSELRKQSTLYRKLHKDFQAQCQQFEQTMQSIVSKTESHTSGNVTSQSRKAQAGSVSSQNSEALLQDQIAFDMEEARLRERDLASLHSNVVKVNSMFNDLSVLVHEQTDDINHIESNFNEAADNTEAALSELQRSSLNKRKINPIAAWLLFALLVFVVVLIVINLS